MAWHSETEKQRFIARVAELGNHAAACREFCIHPSTGHRWRNAPLPAERQAKRARARSRSSDPALHQVIKDLIWLNPRVSCAGYAESLRDSGFHVSPTTIQKLMNGWGLRSIDDRLDAVEERWVDTGEALPLSTLRALKTSGRMTDAANFNTEYPGQVIALRRIRWSRKECRYPYLLLAVDVYSMLIRCKLWDGESVGVEVALFQGITEFFRRRLFLKNPDRVIHDGKRFSEISAHQFRIVSVEPESKQWPTALDSLVDHVEGVMRSQLFPILVENERQIAKLGYLAPLTRWEWDFNIGHRFSGFPNFGLSPMESVMDYEKAVASRDLGE